MSAPPDDAVVKALLAAVTALRALRDCCDPLYADRYTDSQLVDLLNAALEQGEVVLEGYLGDRNSGGRA